MVNPIIEMRKIEKLFPGVRALDAIDFDLRAGEVHALMGENGAGKSTLVKILSGVYQADGGDILIDGKEVSFATPRAAQDQGIGIIHQELALMPDLTAAQNIWIGREPRRSFGRIDEDVLNAQTRAIFDEMNIKMDPHQKVDGLTIARQQMVEIAKALSFRSRILVMDEPTAALNDKEIEDLFKIIRRLKSEGVAIIYISHKMDEILRISDRVTVMRDGALIGTKDTKETTIDEIITMMVGRAVSNTKAKVPDLGGAPTALDVIDASRKGVLHNISFSLRKGEILGIAGLVGAGRTELARAIFGAEPFDQGMVHVFGKPVTIARPVDAVMAGIGYLSEDRKRYGLALGMSVRDNIAATNLAKLADRLGRINEDALGKVSEKYIDQLQIKTPSANQVVRLLSGGNQQKIVIAKWLFRDSEILIFDEPTRGIDVGAKAEIYQLMAQLAADGKAIIIISSELPEILRVSHRIAVMSEGRLSGILPATATQEEIMALATEQFEAATAV